MHELVKCRSNYAVLNFEINQLIKAGNKFNAKCELLISQYRDSISSLKLSLSGNVIEDIVQLNRTLASLRIMPQQNDPQVVGYAIQDVSEQIDACVQATKFKDKVTKEITILESSILQIRNELNKYEAVILKKQKIRHVLLNKLNAAQRRNDKI